MGLAARGRYTHELGKEIEERYKAEFQRYVKSVVQQMIQSAKTQGGEYVMLEQMPTYDYPLY